MSSSLIKPEELERYKKQSEIITETAEQLIRDFARFGIDIVFSGNVSMAYEELFHQLVPQMDQLIRYETGKLQALLYQIDLDETELSRFKPADPSFSLQEHLSDLILQRELKKVVTRDFFRNRKDSDKNT